MNETQPPLSSLPKSSKRGRIQFLAGLGIYAVLISLIFTIVGYDDPAWPEQEVNFLYFGSILLCLLVLPILGLPLLFLKATRMLGVSFLLAGVMCWLLLIMMAGSMPSSPW
jgi:hypothetical protein